MRKSGLILIVLAVLVGLGGYMVLASQSDDSTNDSRQAGSTTAPQPTQASPTEESQGNPDMAESSEVSQVEIINMAYRPANIAVKKGTTVTWTNKDSVRHDIAPDEESDAFRGSQLLARGESYSFTFDIPGTYSYHCSPHPHMNGVVTVTD